MLRKWCVFQSCNGEKIRIYRNEQRCLNRKRTELSMQELRLNHQDIQGKGLMALQNTVCTLTSGMGNRLSRSQSLRHLLIKHKFAHSKHHCEATSSHNSILTITIITRFLPTNLYSARINHRQSLQGPLSQTTSYNLTEKPHHCKGETVHKASVRPVDWLDRPADWQDVMHMAGRRDRDVWLRDRHLYRAGEQHGSGPRPTVLKPGMGSGGASKPDKRLLCFGRQQ